MTTILLLLANYNYGLSLALVRITKLPFSETSPTVSFVTLFSTFPPSASIFFWIYREKNVNVNQSHRTLGN
jgi:hypothetical protein